MTTVPQQLAGQHAVPDDLVELGRVSGSYGVRGWVKVEPFSQQSSILLESKRWWVRARANAQPQPWSVLTSRPQGSTVVAQVHGLEVREAAAAWKGAYVLVSRAEFPKTDEDEFYWVDLIGCHVDGQDDDGQTVYLGVVEHVSDNGAHGVLHVRRMQARDSDQPLLDSRGKEQQSLLPFVAAHVLGVDLSERHIVTNWPADV